MVNIEQLASKTRLLGGLSPTSLRKIIGEGRTEQLNRGKILFVEGEAGTAIYILAAGSMRLFRSDEEGREATVHFVRPGELFAEVVLFDREQYPVTAEARESSTVVRIGRSHVLSLLADEEFRFDFLANVMRKLSFLASQVYILSSCEVRERLLRFLSRRFGPGPRYRMDLSKREVAEAIATTPETLSRVLAKLERREELVWRRNEIHIADSLRRGDDFA